jgi:predicted ATPase
MPRYILTGGPGAGKTTLLGALASLGYTTVEESARSIIAERLAAGVTPRPQATQFAREILRRDIEKYEMTRGLPDPVFFDRSVVEAFGSVQETETWPRLELERMLAAYPFDRPVFILPPWPAIYTVDTERDQSFGDAVNVYEKVVQWYSHCGYPLHEVPCLPVEERAKYVHQAVSCRDA